MEIYEIEVQALGASNIPVKEITLCGNFRNWSIVDLAAGKQYQFTITPIYEDGIPGVAVSTVKTITESGKCK